MYTVYKRKLNFTLLGNVSSVLAQQLSIYGISILTFGIIARILSAEQMGLYAIIVSLVSLISAMANLGIKRFGVRMISAMNAEDDKRRSSFFWTATFISILFIIMITSITTYCLVALHIFDISNPKLDPIIFFILLTLYSFKICASSGLEGLKLFHRVTIYISFGFLIYRILMIYAVLMGYGVTGIMIAWCIGEIFSLTVLFKDTIPRFRPIKIDYNFKEILSNALPLTASDAVLAAIDWVDRLIVAIYGYSSIAIFYVATTGITFLSAIAQAIYSGTLPHLSEAFHKNDLPEFSGGIRSMSKYIILFTSPIYMLAVALAQPTIIILVGPKYLAATIVFQIMALGLWITSINPLLYTTLIAAGKSVELMYIMIISLIVDVAFLLIFYPLIGIIATGIGRSLLMATSFTLSILVAQKVINIDVDISTYVKASLSSVIMATIIIILWTYIRHLSLYPFYIILGVTIYFGMIRLLKIITIDEMTTLYTSLPDRVRFIVKILCYLLGISYRRLLVSQNAERE